MTVSRVVNQNGYVSDETREKVMRAVGDLNYRPNRLARGLKQQRTDTIGLVLGDIANPYAAELPVQFVRLQANAGITSLFASANIVRKKMWRHSILWQIIR